MGEHWQGRAAGGGRGAATGRGELQDTIPRQLCSNPSTEAVGEEAVGRVSCRALWVCRSCWDTGFPAPPPPGGTYRRKTLKTRERSGRKLQRARTAGQIGNEQLGVAATVPKTSLSIALSFLSPSYRTGGPTPCSEEQVGYPHSVFANL